MSKRSVNPSKTALLASMVEAEAINKSLGHADALKLLAYMHREPTDYVKVSHELYKGQSIAEIFQRAQNDCQK